MCTFWTLDTMLQWDKVRAEISAELRKIYWLCDNASTIAQSNRIWDKTLSMAKKNALLKVEGFVDKTIISNLVDEWWNY